MRIVGVAFHSPVDLISIVPVETAMTCLPDEEADLLISEDVHESFKATLCVVVGSISDLQDRGIKILDLGKDGQILPLRPNLLDRALRVARKGK